MFEIGFSLISQLSDAFIFTSDGNIFLDPNVPKPIFPIDLTIIITRLENCFYRRLDHIKFDIKRILKNVEKHLYIHKDFADIMTKAELITNVCLDFIDDNQLEDPLSLYDLYSGEIRSKNLQNITNLSDNSFRNMNIKKQNESNCFDNDENEVDVNDIEIIEVKNFFFSFQINFMTIITILFLIKGY